MTSSRERAANITSSQTASIEGHLIEPTDEPVSSEITITHNRTDGTLLYGVTWSETRKGTQVRKVLDKHHWRWKRGHDAWGLLGSSNHRARRWRINPTVAGLRELGYTVTVEIDDTPRDPADVERERRQDDEWRARHYAEKAKKNSATAEAIDSATDKDRKVINNNPVLIGHHSQRRHERLLARLRARDEKAAEARRKASHYEQRAKTAAHSTDARNSKETTGNRIARLEADLRRLHREGANQDEIAETADALAFWREQWAAKVARREWEEFGPHNVQKGGAVRVSGQWRRVARVSAKSVSVETGYSWTDRVPWHQVQRYVAPKSVGGPGNSVG